MINLLWLLLILGVDVALLWLAYKFFGKIGLFVYGTFAVIQANFQTSVGVINVGEIGVVANVATWLTLLLTIVTLLHKYGAKSVLAFTILVGGAMGATLLTDLFAMYAMDMEITFMSIFTSSLCTFLLFGIECLIAVVVNELFRGSKISDFLKLVIILAVLVVLDVILFCGVQSINLPFGQAMLDFALANLWQKAVVFALMIPMIYVLLKTKDKDLEAILEKGISEEPAEKSEEKTEEKVEEKTEEPVQVEEVQEPREVEIIVEAEEEKKPAKKTTTKKTAAKAKET